jgi:starch synthase
LERSDAIITYNQNEARLLGQKYPKLNIVTHSHGVAVHEYKKNHRKKARTRFPQIRNKDLLICVARIDPVKNQLWLVQQAPQIFSNHPEAIIFLAGPVTNEVYAKKVVEEIAALGLSNRIILTGNFPPGDPQLIGLLQEAKALILPSLAEPFGLVIIEAWAAETIVLSSRTSGPASIIQSGKNGWLFDLNDPSSFHQMLNESLKNPQTRNVFSSNSDLLLRNKYSSTAIAGQMKKLYETLIESKNKSASSL